MSSWLTQLSRTPDASRDEPRVRPMESNSSNMMTWRDEAWPLTFTEEKRGEDERREEGREVVGRREEDR